MNGNIVSCNSYGLKFYKKENNEYKILSMQKLIDIVNNVVEKIRTVEIFHFIFDILLYISLICKKQEISKLKSSHVSDRYYGGAQFSFNYIINGGFLFVKYGFNSDIYDINQNMELVNKKNDNDNEKKETNFPFKKFYCNYDDDGLFVVKEKDEEPKIFSYRNKTFQIYKDFPFTIPYLRDILKYNNKYFIIYSSNEIFILKRIN